MIIRNQIVKTLTSTLLMLVLMLPLSAEVLLSLNGHEHIPCEEQLAHIHEDSPVCFVCDFRLVSFDYDILEETELIKIDISEEVYQCFKPFYFYSYNLRYTQLRAPPAFLV